MKQTLDSCKNIDYDKQGTWHSNNNSNNNYKHSIVGSGSHTYNTGNIGSNNATSSHNSTNSGNTSSKPEFSQMFRLIYCRLVLGLGLILWSFDLVFFSL